MRPWSSLQKVLLHAFAPDVLSNRYLTRYPPLPRSAFLTEAFATERRPKAVSGYTVFRRQVGFKRDKSLPASN